MVSYIVILYQLIVAYCHPHRGFSKSVIKEGKKGGGGGGGVQRPLMTINGY